MSVVCAPTTMIGSPAMSTRVDLRLEDALGQVAADLGDRVAHVVDGAVGRRADLELDEGVAVALAHRAVDLVDAVDAADRGFDALGDLSLHLVRRRARLATPTRSRPGSRCPDCCSPASALNATRPASIRPTNSTIGGTGLRMHQEEMLRKFMDLDFLAAGRSLGCLTLGLDLLARVEKRAGREDDALHCPTARRRS